MDSKMVFNPRFILAAGVLAAAGSPAANAGCGCPSDGNGAPAAASGLGQEAPAAPDLATDTAWQVYEFERDGIRYTQVNDQTGRVRAAVGRIGDTFWVMPIGSDADRVTLQGESAPAGVPQLLFQSQDVEVLLYQDGTTQRWQVRSPSTR